MFVRKCRIMRSADATDVGSIKTRAIAPSSTLQLIGWDDVKCRPIFEKTLKPVPISDEDDDEEDDDLPAEEVVNSELDEKPGRKKSKAYGSRKRESAVIERTTFTTLLHKNTNTTLAKEWTAPVPCTSSCFPYASPLVVDESICDALDSGRKHVTTASTQINVPRNKSFVVETNLADGMTLKKRRRSSSKTKDTCEEGANVDGVKATKQPSSTTSVAAAKAFFDRLDAIELQLDVSETPDIHIQKECGRSKRPVDLNDGDLLHEYEGYSDASLESGVTPISLVEYAENQWHCFRRHKMFDGFLDG